MSINIYIQDVSKVLNFILIIRNLKSLMCAVAFRIRSVFLKIATYQFYQLELAM